MTEVVIMEIILGHIPATELPINEDILEAYLN